MHCLWFFVVYLPILREELIGTSGSRIPWFGQGSVLLTFSIINLIIAIIYTGLWYGKYLKKSKGQINNVLLLRQMDSVQLE